MTTRLWWVRHAPTHATGFVGWRDIPADLSDRVALSRLSAALPQKAVLVSSDLQRARATADALMLPQRRRLADRAALREMDFGDWDGMAMDAVARLAPDQSRDFWENPGETAPPNGESWNRFSARIASATDQLLAEHGGGDIIVVAHFAVILAALQRASGMSARAAFSFRIDNLSVSRTDHISSAQAWRVCQVNMVNHPR